MEKKPVTAVILGAGHRSLIYGDVSLCAPQKLKIVGVADVDPQRAAFAAQRYKIPAERVFSDVGSLAKAGRIADAVINGTLDSQHVPTSLPLLALGYDMLLEKPFATNSRELAELYVTARKYQNRVFICHVLRYSSFYLGIRRALAEGKIGKIISINMAEDISRHHMVIAYVRGQWNNENNSSPLLLAKSCHDIDLMMWLMQGDLPETVYSVGGDFCFTPDKAPKSAGTRCLLDCPLEEGCPYSAAKHYLGDNTAHDFYVWKHAEMTDEEKRESLKRDNPYGRCVWKCGHEGVDHQSVTVTFQSGAVGIFTLTGGAVRDERRIQIVGTEGTISGAFEDNRFVLRRHKKDGGYEEEQIEGTVPALTLHGGGDESLVLDFCDYISGGKPSLSCSELGDSLSGHLVVFAAEKSRKTGRPIHIEM